jgi:nucleotide-binding universal stress UspA family protein
MSDREQPLSPGLLFTKIVVAIDGSENSIRAAQAAVMMAAQRQTAEVVGVFVVNIDQYLQSLGLYRISYPTSVQKKIEEAREEAQKWFGQVQQIADQMNVKFRGEVIDTPLSVVAAIVNFAENQKADLIVVGTRGRSGFTRLVMGSVASGVVTYAPCPVLVIR